MLLLLSSVASSCKHRYWMCYCHQQYCVAVERTTHQIWAMATTLYPEHVPSPFPLAVAIVVVPLATPPAVHRTAACQDVIRRRFRLRSPHANDGNVVDGRVPATHDDDSHRLASTLVLASIRHYLNWKRRWKIVAVAMVAVVAIATCPLLSRDVAWPPTRHSSYAVDPCYSLQPNHDEMPMNLTTPRVHPHLSMDGDNSTSCCGVALAVVQSLQIYLPPRLDGFHFCD